MRALAVDDIIIALGWWGPYQKQQFIGLFLHIFAIAFHAMSIVFIGRQTEHKCAPKSEAFFHMLFLSEEDNRTSAYNITARDLNSTTIDYKKCSIDVKDSYGRSMWSGDCPYGYQYGEPRDRTIVSEWDLVCDKGALSDVSQTVFALGMAAGAAFFPALADKFGRKPIYMVAHVILLLVCIITVFVPDFITFLVLRFLTGAAQQGVCLVAWVTIVELLPTRNRSLATQVILIAWPTGLLVLGLIGWLNSEMSWRTMQLSSVGLSAYIVIQWWLSDETIRWLIANNRTQEAEEIIRRAAKRNKASMERVMDVFSQVTKPQPEFVTITESCMTDDGNTSNSKLLEPMEPLPENNGDNSKHVDPLVNAEVKNGTHVVVEEVGVFEAMKNKKVLKVTVISAYIWFAGGATYFGLIMTADTLIDDLYLGYTVNILVEIPAGVVFLLLVNRMGRRLNVSFYQSITGVSLLLAVLLTTIPAAQSLPGARIAAILVSLLGKFAITAGFGAMWMYTPEYFPTNIRTTCLGIAALASRIGAMVAPYARTLGRHVPWLPGLIFSIMCFVTLGVTWFLPETFNREMPQTIADMETLMEQQRTRPKSKDVDTKC